MAKRRDRGHDGARVIPAHWRAPEVSSVPAVFSDNPADWPLGPCWATRIDGIGSQALFLARQRPLGNLSIVGATVNETRGLTDTLGEHAVGAARFEKMAAHLSGLHGRAYPVTPEYVAWRIRQGEERSNAAGGQPPSFLHWRALLAGLDAAQGPDFVALEDELHQPVLLDKTGVLIFTYEFGDWWLGREEGETVAAYLTAAHDGLLLLEQGGIAHGARPADALPEAALLSETRVMHPPAWFTDAGLQTVAQLMDEYGMRIFDAAMAQRFRQRLQHMAYLTQRAGQAQLSALIATAAWGLRPERGFPPAHHPFVQGILRLTALSAVLGQESHASPDHDHDHAHGRGRRPQVHPRRGRRR